MRSVPEPGFDQRIADWLEEDPDRAPATVLETVTAAVPSISQRRQWRLPRRSDPMFKIAIASAAIVLLGVALLLVPRQPSVNVTATQPPASPVATPPASPSASGQSIFEYRAQRDAICDAGVALTDPLRSRFVDYTASLTDAQILDGADAFDAFAAVDETLIPQLAALDPPAFMGNEHALDVLDYQLQAVLVRRIALELRDHNLTAAKADDAETEIPGARIGQFEGQYVLHPCP